MNAVGNVKLSQQPLKVIKLTSADIDALNDQRMRNYLNEILRNQSPSEMVPSVDGTLPSVITTEMGDNISGE